MQRTLKQLAQEAIHIQDACNLTGLVQGWAKVVMKLRELEDDGLMSTGMWNRHPINQLWASKLHDLAGMGFSDDERYHEAYEKCKLMAGVTNGNASLEER